MRAILWKTTLIYLHKPASLSALIRLHNDVNDKLITKTFVEGCPPNGHFYRRVEARNLLPNSEIQNADNVTHFFLF